MNRKGIELAFNTIIVAVILLIVAVILIAIFTSKVNWFNESTATCYSKGGECSKTGKCGDGIIIYTEDCDFMDSTANPAVKVEGRYGQCCIPTG